MLTYGHGGNVWALAKSAGWDAGELLDFSANINPLGPPEWLRQLISSRISTLVHYPDPCASVLAQSFAEQYGIPAEQVLVGNGSTEILYALPKIAQRPRAVIPVPAYVDYRKVAELAGIAVQNVFLREEETFRLDLSVLESVLQGDEIVFLGQPNNPTGMTFSAEALRHIAARHPSTIFVIDEAFADFIEGMDRLTRNRPSNVVVLCSLTKFYAIPGLRLGCAIADHALSDQLRKVMPPWSVNTLAQAVGEKALQDHDYAEKTRQTVRKLRESLSEQLRSVQDLTVYPGEANFLLARIDRSDIDAPALARRLLEKGIMIRVCANYDGLDTRFFRVAVRTKKENDRLLQSIRAAFGLARSTPRKRRKVPAVMFQGTGSNAGKSILTAAMCRILLQDGYRVAPFKSQNMALNSFVTRDGCEMGRAQAVQAQACRLDPDVRMNPVLLKPSSDTGSQVIVQGHPVGNMEIADYIRYKPEAFQKAKEGYDSLADEFDAIVLEGAGSPGEVNLKHHDIVNMNMARYADAPVLLVGDIDRGGVFASFIGTMEVLAEWERRMVAGFVVNKFRGKENLLDDAIAYTQRHTGRPVLGVVPFLKDLGLPEEDSVGFKSGAFDDQAPRGEGVEIAVIDLPHISNFTDFDPLRMEPDVRLRIIRSARDLDNPDAVILPGSKNVINDLSYLRRAGFDRRIAELADAKKTEVIGICGGFQVLGREVADPYGIESGGKTLQGLGLIPVQTVLAREKTLTRVRCTHLPSGTTLQGYEIHHGQTECTDLIPMIRRQDGEIIGAGTKDYTVWGTYLHG
ncbi:MAG: cobyric acid synthase, partial [Desulforhabdus sp.]|nr:cobyric acid synthase [Desulforhabdus sp.]